MSLASQGSTVWVRVVFAKGGANNFNGFTATARAGLELKRER